MCVYLAPRWFAARPLGSVLRWTALAYSLSVAAAFVIFLGIPIVPI